MMSIDEVELKDLSETRLSGNVSLLPNLEMLKHVKVTLEVRIGEASLSIADLFALKSGSVLTLNRLVEEPVEILLNGATVAVGHLAVSGDSLGIRISEIMNSESQLLS